MDITNEERKIKIRKIQESAEIEENLKENGVIKKGGKFFNFEKLSISFFARLFFWRLFSRRLWLSRRSLPASPFFFLAGYFCPLSFLFCRLFKKGASRFSNQP